MDLPIKQQKFINYFIELGNAGEAMRRAGYSPKYAAQNADRLMKQPKVAAAIAARMKELEDASIAKAEEVLKHLTAVMRGEIKEEVIVVEGSGDGYSSARVMTKQISEKDRLKAAELLAKRYGLLTEKVSLGDESGNEIKITVVKAVKSDAAT